MPGGWPSDCSTRVSSSPSSAVRKASARRGAASPHRPALSPSRDNRRRAGNNPPHYGGDMLRVTSTITIDDDELDESFVRASGPGGQNVNKISSAVQLRFDVRRSPNLPNDVRARLERLAGSRLTRDGVLIISAQRHRTQERNRQDARDRLIELIRRAAIAPIPRRATKPTAGSRERRLQTKKRRSSIKGLRQHKPGLE